MKKTILVAVVLFAMSRCYTGTISKVWCQGVNYIVNGSRYYSKQLNYETTAITRLSLWISCGVKLAMVLSIQPGVTQRDDIQNAFTEFKTNWVIYLFHFGKIHFNKTVSLDLGPQASFCVKIILLTIMQKHSDLQPLAVLSILQKYISTRSLCFGSLETSKALKLKNDTSDFHLVFLEIVKTNFIKTVLNWNGFFFITKIQL
jgi:hypothetical protein